MDNLHIIYSVISAVICFSIGFSIALVLIRLGSCIYHDHKAVKQIEVQQEDSFLEAMSKPKGPDKPKKPKPAKGA